MRRSLARENEPLREGATILRTPNTFDFTESLSIKHSRYFKRLLQRRQAETVCLQLACMSDSQIGGQSSSPLGIVIVARGGALDKKNEKK